MSRADAIAPTLGDGAHHGRLAPGPLRLIRLWYANVHI
jgi:hypothetical protein